MSYFIATCFEWSISDEDTEKNGCGQVESIPLYSLDNLLKKDQVASLTSSFHLNKLRIIHVKTFQKQSWDWT